LPNSYAIPDRYLAPWRERYNIEKAYEDKKAIAAASNIGYGKSFEGDDDPIYGEVYIIRGKCAAWEFNCFGYQWGINFAIKSTKSYFSFGLNGTQYHSSIVSGVGLSFEAVGFNFEYDHSNKEWSNELYMGPLVFNKSGTYFRLGGGEIGIGSVIGINFYYNLGYTGPSLNYTNPLFPADRTFYSNPYKIK
jgi:hypothetical protein